MAERVGSTDEGPTERDRLEGLPWIDNPAAHAYEQNCGAMANEDSCWWCGATKVEHGGPVPSGGA